MLESMLTAPNEFVASAVNKTKRDKNTDFRIAANSFVCRTSLRKTVRLSESNTKDSIVFKGALLILF